MLAALRDRACEIGLLSNTHWPRPFHEHFLERDGLVELIDVRCYTSEMTRTKPHPVAFETVLDNSASTIPARPSTSAIAPSTTSSAPRRSAAGQRSAAPRRPRPRRRPRRRDRPPA